MCHDIHISGDSRCPNGGDRRPLQFPHLTASLWCELRPREETEASACPPGQHSLGSGLPLQQADTQVRLPWLWQGNFFSNGAKAMISIYLRYLAQCAMWPFLHARVLKDSITHVTSLGTDTSRSSFSAHFHSQFGFCPLWQTLFECGCWLPSTAPFPPARVCPCFSGSLTELKMDLFSQMFGLMGGPCALCRAWSQNTNDTINQQNRSLSHAKIISYVLFTIPPSQSWKGLLKVSSQCRYLSLSSD